MAIQRIEIPLARRAGVAQSRFVSSQDLINLYLETAQDHGPALYSAPGLEGFATFAAGPVRGAIGYQDLIVAVSGTRIYTVEDDATATDIGEIPGTQPVVMANNGFEVSIVSDEQSFIMDGGTFAVTQITDPDFQQASSVTFLGQYFAYSKASSGEFFLSDLADGTSYDALMRATAESTPDDLRRVIADSGDLLLMGSETIEPWALTGATFPFEARVGGVINLGLLGRDAVARVDNSFAWLASDRTVRILRGSTPMRISDHDIERVIASWPDPQTSRAFSATVGGHAFWFLWNPQGCVVWDVATGFWHQRRTREMTTWRAGCGVTQWNDTFVGDVADGRLYRLREGVYDDAGEEMHREMVTATLGPGGQPFTLHAVELEVEPGVGLTEGQGEDPEVWLEVSRDSGFEYGARIRREIGRRGERRRRVRWNRLGRFLPHGGVLKIGCSDPVAMTMTRCFAEISVERA